VKNLYTSFLIGIALTLILTGAGCSLNKTDELSTFTVKGNEVTINSEDLTFTFPDNFNIEGNTIEFGPETHIPESPTDKEYKWPAFVLKLVPQRSYSEIQESLSATSEFNLETINGVQVGSWEDSVFCETHYYEVIGEAQSIQLMNRGCSGEIDGLRDLLESVKVSEGDEAYLTKALLVANEWGAENGGMGKWIEFHEDGTFKTINREPTDEQSIYGTYQIEKDILTLNNERYGDDLITEEQHAWYLKTRTLKLGETSSSLYLTQFLEEDDRVKYWNQSSLVPDGSERVIQSFPNFALVTVDRALAPELHASIYSSPGPEGSILEYEQDADKIVSSIIARTEYKGRVNGEMDHWYYVDLQASWPMEPLIDGEPSGEGYQYGWIHGSEIK